MSDSVQKKIESLLHTTFHPIFLTVINESNHHNVPPNSETHFKIVIVSNAFYQQTRITRHRTVYALLAALLAKNIHALAIHTYTPQEWQKTNQTFPHSPECQG